ncbi:MAG: hypothetical protein PVH80_01805 [Anaerolineae bacterium]|jgi:hypothetical protein
MRRTNLLLVMAVVLGGAFLAGCQGLEGGRPEVAPAVPPPTPVVRAGSAENGQGQDQPALDLASRFPLPAPKGDVQKVDLDDSQCITCHTDEAEVKRLAVEPEEEEQLSEGEG